MKIVLHHPNPVLQKDSFQTKLQHLIGANHTQHVFTDKTITNLATSKLLSEGHEGLDKVQTSYNRELCLG